MVNVWLVNSTEESGGVVQWLILQGTSGLGRTVAIFCPAGQNFLGNVSPQTQFPGGSIFLRHRGTTVLGIVTKFP